MCTAASAPCAAQDVSSVLRDAEAAEKAHQYEQAARLYQRWLNQSQAGPAAPGAELSAARNEVRLRLATAFFMAHNYRESISAIQPMLRQQPSHLPFQAYLVAGLDNLELNQLDAAMTLLRRALKVNPDSGTARLALGDALARSGRMEAAVEQYNDQTRRTPAVADAWYKLGVAYSALAVQQMQTFGRRHPLSVVARQFEAEQMLGQGNSGGALQILLPIAAGDGKKSIPAGHGGDAFSPNLRADLGWALLQLGHARAAAVEFRRELSGNPESAAALLGLAQTAALSSGAEAALPLMEKLWRDHPRELLDRFSEPPPAVLKTAWDQRRLGLKSAGAANEATRLWVAWLRNEQAPVVPESQLPAGSCAELSKSAGAQPGFDLTGPCYARLARRLKRQTELTPSQRTRLAECDYHMGKMDEARRDALAALRRDADDGWGAYYLARAEQALSYRSLSRASTLNPNSARVHQFLARYYMGRFEMAKAESEYLKAIHIDPSLPDLHFGLGTLYWQAGNWDAAAKELEQTLQLEPGSQVAAYELGDCYVNQRQWVAAIPYLRSAASESRVGSQARLDLAKALAESGKRAEAIDLLQTLAASDADGQIHYRLAALYRQAGNAARAQEALKASEALRQAAQQEAARQARVFEQQRESLEQAESHL